MNHKESAGKSAAKCAMNCSTNLLIMVFAAMFLSACASTQFTGVWTDENYKGGPIKSIMIVGVAKNQRNRNIFESAMVNAFNQQGVHAVASTKLLDDKKITKENVIQAAEANHLQTVLVTRFTGKTQQEVYNPPNYYYGWDSFYPTMYGYVGSPGYYTTFQYVHLETNIYTLPQKQMIWSAASQTVDPDNINQDSVEFAQKVVEKLKSSKLI
jgi:hypothetical protein